MLFLSAFIRIILAALGVSEGFPSQIKQIEYAMDVPTTVVPPTVASATDMSAADTDADIQKTMEGLKAIMSHHSIFKKGCSEAPHRLMSEYAGYIALFL